MAYLEQVFIEGSSGAVLDSAVGTPNTQALTIQGNASGVPVPVSGIVSISNFPSTQPVSLASTTITGTVAVTQSTAPWIVAGGGTAGTPGTAVLTVQGVSGGTAIPVSGTITTAPPANASTNITQWDSTALGVPTAYGVAPTIGNYIGVNAYITNTVPVTGTFWQATQPVSIAGTVTVSLVSTTITGTVAVTQSTSPWVVSGTVTTTPSGLQNVNLTQLNSVALGSPSNYGTSPGAISVQGVNAFITNTPAVTLASTTITGSVAVTGTFWQATQPVSLASTTITGTVAVTQSTSPWVVSGTVTTTPSGLQNVNLTQLNSVALGSPSNYGTSPGAVSVQGVNAFITNTVPVTLASTTITGSVAVTGTFWQATQPVSIAGTVAVTQSTSPWVISGTVTTTPPANASTNITQWDSVALGAPSAYGTSPGAVNVPGVNAFITNTPAVTLASTTITGSVAVTGTFWQATQPVSIAGTVTVSLASTTITGTVAVTQSGPWTVGITGTTNWGTAPATSVSVLGVNAENFIGQTALAAVSNYGTAPSAVAAMGVNAFITNTVPVTLASTTITGTVAVTQSTSPWVVSLASTTITGTVAENLIQVAGVTLGATAVTNFGTAPAAAVVPGVNASIFAGTTGITATGTSLNVNVTNTVPVTLASTTITGTVAVTQSTSPWVVSGTVTITPSGLQNVNVTQWDTIALGAPSAYGTSPGAVNVIGVNASITNTVPVTLASTTITGTVAVTQSTSPWVANLTQVAGVVLGATAVTAFGTAPAAANVPGVNASIFSGTTGITATGTSLNVNLTNSLSIAGALTNNNAAPTATLLGVLGATAETAYTTVTYTTGDMVLPVTDLHGALNSDLQAVAGVALGATAVTAFGTAPAAANVPGVNSSIFAGTTGITATGTSLNVNVTNATQVVVGNLTNNNAAPTATLMGVLGAIAETAYATITYTTGDMVLPVMDLHGATNTDLQAVAGTAVVAASAGVQKVGISGATGATLDAVITAATAPVNGVAVLGVNNTTPPSLTTGQSVALQVDYEGDLFVKPIRRSQSVGATGTFTSATATQLLAAQAAGIFADLSTLVITQGLGTTANVYFSVNVSDGTATYKFNMFSNDSVTVTPTGSQPLTITFNPPLPATSAATAWTVALSSATDVPTVNVTAVFVLQKAS